ncbi:MAG: hypothetical protein KDK99_20660 [Verrucomicrobiales bacterium]|nr:hypothetical protein [Verrucomicrobiales bacterium]
MIFETPPILLSWIAGILIVSAILWQWGAKESRLRHWGWIAGIPSAAMLITFFSLAMHMRLSLGSWPLSIGEAGFSNALRTHAHWATQFFSWVLLVTFFLLPALLLLGLGWKRVRSLWKWFGVHGFTFCLALFLMMLAPAKFLRWWWD